MATRLFLKIIFVGWLAPSLIACDTTGQYGSDTYFWYKKDLQKQKAFSDVVFCMDSADAAFQRRNKNQTTGYGSGLAGAVTVMALHFGSLNNALGDAHTGYDQCMYERGYQARKLTKDQLLRLGDSKTNIERAEALSGLMASPLEAGSYLVPAFNTQSPELVK